MIRDSYSNALPTTDTKALDKYRMEKQRIKQIEELRKDVADIKEQISNIHKLLDRIIEEK